MREILERALKSLQRDRTSGLGAGVIARKSLRNLQELATAPLYLQSVTVRGAGVRTLGRPRIDNQGYMAIGANTLLRSVNVPVELATGPGARLEIGREVSINFGVSIGCLGQILIGDRCRIGPYAMIVDSQFHDLYDRSRRPPPKPVRIDDDVWIGAKASVLPGVTIGRGAVVGTSAVVTSDVEAFTIVAGVPARPVSRLDPERFLEEQRRAAADASTLWSSVGLGPHEP